MDKTTDRIYSAGDVAAERGVVPQTVTRIAAKTGIGQRISGVWTFTEQQKTAILPKIRTVRGNPKFILGHDLVNGRGKLLKKTDKKRR